MSMPSSSDEVATIAGSSPRFRRSSISCRFSRATEPWCASASSSPAVSLMAAASRSARRRLLAKIIVERCARIELDQARVDRGPDRALPRAGRGGAGGNLFVRASRAMSSTGTSTVSASSLRVCRRRRSRPAAASRRRRGRATSPPPSRRAISSSGRCVAERPMRWSGRGRRGAALLEPLEREEEVRAALGRGHRVDLVDDHRLDRGEDGLAAREVSSRYSDSGVVIRMSGGVRAIRARSRAGVSPERIASGRDPMRDAEPRRRGRDAGDRRAQVALDVDGEGLQRRDVEDAAALRLGGLRREHQPVDRRQKGRQRLARAGRREEQRRAPAQDRRPALFLGRRGPGEGRAKPVADRRRESGERFFGHPRILCVGRATRHREKRAAPEGSRPSQKWPAVRPTACAWA